MSGCNCTGNCRTAPYTCGGTVNIETLEEIESIARSRWNTLYKKEEKHVCPTCGCHKQKSQKEYLTE